MEAGDVGSSSGRIGRMRIRTPSSVLPSCSYSCGYGRMAKRGRSASAISAGWRTTRASRAMTRSGEASSGLMSISAMRGCSATSSLKRTSSAASTSLSIGLRPRTPLSTWEIVVSPIRCLARVVLSGGRASARSLKTSTSWPPIPNSSTGPNCGSGLLPTISS